MPIYMGIFEKVNVLDRSLRGSVTAKGYEGWIELQGVQLRGQMSGSNAAAGSRAAKPKPRSEDIEITKLPDVTSRGLLHAASRGSARLVVIAYVQGDGTAYRTIVMPDAIFSSYLPSDGKIGAPESWTLTFSKITFNTLGKSPDATRWALQQLDQTGP